MKLLGIFPALVLGFSLVNESITLASDEAEQSAPTHFKVYSNDGRESLTATCNPIGSAANQVNCEIIHVRFHPPKQDTLPPLDGVPGVELEKARREFCSSKTKDEITRRIRAPDTGPKMKLYYQELIAACSEEDPRVFFERLPGLEQRTCSVWVDRFALEFKKVRDRHWLHQQQRPGLITKVLKIYELTRDDFRWSLTETRVPMQGSDELSTRTLWGWKPTEYELPCDFISHRLVQMP